jgi:hypothetical protein
LLASSFRLLQRLPRRHSFGAHLLTIFIHNGLMAGAPRCGAIASSRTSPSRAQTIASPARSTARLAAGRPSPPCLPRAAARRGCLPPAHTRCYGKQRAGDQATPSVAA